MERCALGQSSHRFELAKLLALLGFFYPYTSLSSFVFVDPVDSPYA